MKREEGQDNAVPSEVRWVSVGVVGGVEPGSNCHPAVAVAVAADAAPAVDGVVAAGVRAEAYSLVELAPALAALHPKERLPVAVPHHLD